MLFSRLVVLLNLPGQRTHVEARLFDPDGKIRKTICQDQYLNDINACHFLFIKFHALLGLVPFQI
jgi:hypothetical protein